jgi:hypothetical protein
MTTLITIICVVLYCMIGFGVMKLDHKANNIEFSVAYMIVWPFLLLIISVEDN